MCCNDEEHGQADLPEQGNTGVYSITKKRSAFLHEKRSFSVLLINQTSGVSGNDHCFFFFAVNVTLPYKAMPATPIRIQRVHSPGWPASPVGGSVDCTKKVAEAWPSILRLVSYFTICRCPAQYCLPYISAIFLRAGMSFRFAIPVCCFIHL